MMDAQFCEYTKRYRILQVTWENSMLYDAYLYKLVLFFFKK